MAVLCLVFIVDSVATDICTKMKAEICHYLFDDSTAVMDTLGMLASVVMIAAAIYKSMSDRFGRKIFLVLNTVAIGVGMLIVYIAGQMGSVPVYIIGSLFITFFIAHDMQNVYVLETVPAKYRFTILSVIGAPRMPWAAICAQNPRPPICGPRSSVPRVSATWSVWASRIRP